MNTIHHHPEDETLSAYAAGALPAALALVVGCHLEFCARCRGVVAQDEEIGGALIEGLTPPPPGAAARAEMLARLDSEPAASTAPAASATAAPASSAMPRKLRGLMGDEALEARPWRSAGPGVRMLSLNCGEGNALLLDIAPGHAVPEHSHRGTELTLILKGDYDDSLGHFGCGDVADLDGRIEHQPKAGAQGCLCLAGLDGPLRYKGWLPRLLQPFFPL